jgi:hypothetical protein
MARNGGVESIRMQTLFNYAVPIAIAAVFIVLCIGIYSLFRGGEFARTYSNKLMRLRVLLQFIAIILLMAAFWWSTRGRG